MARPETHFELFGIPAGFDVDLDSLRERYRALQAAVHPDRFASASDQERRISMQQATQVNEAFQVLKDPLRRGRYLLELGGYEFDEQRTTRDTVFLMEQIELREHLDEIKEAEDKHAAIAGFMSEIGGKRAALIGDLRRQLAEDGSESRAAAAVTLTRLQFFAKLQSEAEELEEALSEAF